MYMSAENPDNTPASESRGTIRYMYVYIYAFC